MENGAKFVESTMIIGSNDAEFGYRLKIVTTYYRQRDLTLGVF